MGAVDGVTGTVLQHVLVQLVLVPRYGLIRTTHVEVGAIAQFELYRRDYTKQAIAVSPIFKLVVAADDSDRSVCQHHLHLYHIRMHVRSTEDTTMDGIRDGATKAKKKPSGLCWCDKPKRASQTKNIEIGLSG